MSRRAVIIGCGYTGSRTAKVLLGRGWSVTATTRNPENLADLCRLGAGVLGFEASRDARAGVSVEGASLLLSIPTLRSGDKYEDPTPAIVAALDGCPSHLIYLSTTAVYGATRDVDRNTPPAPRLQRHRRRLEAEEAVRSHPSPSLVLRPAAIYGPGRGVHAAMLTGRFRLLQGRTRYVSRVHVDDLADIVAWAMEKRLTGVFPVADRLPAPSRDVAKFCAGLLGLRMPPSVRGRELAASRRADRRVDGAAVLDALGLRLRYPTFREGIPASIRDEGASRPLDCLIP